MGPQRARADTCKGLDHPKPSWPRDQFPRARIPRSPLVKPNPTSPARSADGLRSSLHHRGQRVTPQRQRVLNLFERLGEGSHLSAEEVHQCLLRAEERVSLATVYRTLRLLSAMGLLQELELPEGGRRFELARDHHRQHHHLVCVRCGRTEEFENAAVLAAGQAAASMQGFSLLECVLNVRALCPSCTQTEP
jgi:Fur family ferric uptake transcriptional regulator